jgi:hypothetical protein
VGEGRHQLSKLRPVRGHVGDLLAEHLFAPGRFRLGKLVGQVLGVGRDAGIAVNHARVVRQNCIKKVQSYQRFSFEPNILTAAG